MRLNHTIQESETVKSNSIIYSINNEKKTASVIRAEEARDEIIIPRLINYNSSNYIVTSILENAFKDSKIKSIDFARDSEIQTIGKNAF